MTRDWRADHDRLRSGSGIKWASLPGDTIGAWVADMDFGIPPAVKDAIIETTEREDFGYPFWRDGDPVVTAFAQRMERFGWTPSPDRARVFSDVIQVLQIVIEHVTSPGDGIALHVPNYPPFLASIAESGRRAVPIPMERLPTGWGFDADGLARRLRARDCRLLVLVNPHNPTGRMFTRPELESLAAVAEELDVPVLCDEIHADLSYPPGRHIPFATVSEDAARRTVTTTSATKAFNIAGLRCAVAHVGDKRLHETLAAAPPDYYGQPGIIGRAATVAAWTECDAWLADLMTLLSANRDVVAGWADRNLGENACTPPEATYLAWLDVARRLPHPAPAAHIERLGKVKLVEGAEFSDTTTMDTSGFVRLNFATDTATLTEILRRMETALTGY